jgi:hypothetical protein
MDSFCPDGGDPTLVMGSSSGWKWKRLLNAIARLHPKTIENIWKVTEHEGRMEILWKCEPGKGSRKSLEESWACENEYDVVHHVFNFSIRRNKS